jgi:2-keto-4-pentenoate hydratase/2-oxohepta-3-ene-1,7-dioic acid hydratase in catechol pathway
MKLFRYGVEGAEKPGVELSDGKRIDVSAFTPDFNEAFFTSGKLADLSAWVAKNAGQCPVVANDERIGACVARPSKIVCVGLNYVKHAEETGLGLPTEPIIFFKSTTALNGPNDPVVIPKNSAKTDWEVELAVVIGKKASYVSHEEALSYVAGYCVHNDYSERAFQLERSGQWVKGKSADTFAPLGPYLVTTDEIPDPQKLHIWLEVNGEMLQNSNTDDMVFDVSYIVHYISQFMTLLPGDVISTGTPFGVGMGLKPQRYLKPGDVVTLGIAGLGAQRQVAEAYVG